MSLLHVYARHGVTQPEEHGRKAADAVALAVVPQQGNPEKPGNFDLVHASRLTCRRTEKHVRKGE